MRKTTKTVGRPAFRPTVRSRRIVEEMKLVGESETVIARALGIDPATLRKHFADELDHGYAHRRQEIVGMLFGAARKGNVAAMKKLEELGRAAGAAETVKARETPVPKLGKKDEQHEAAKAVGGKFAVPAAPKLVVDNR